MVLGPGGCVGGAGGTLPCPTLTVLMVVGHPFMATAIVATVLTVTVKETLALSPPHSPLLRSHGRGGLGTPAGSGGFLRARCATATAKSWPKRERLIPAASNGGDEREPDDENESVQRKIRFPPQVDDITLLFGE